MPKERPEAKVIPKTPFIPFKLFQLKLPRQMELIPQREIIVVLHNNLRIL